ncbi:hypothetical protein M8J76_009149 [Diaphorina citri]|nr:hypothetical protein M8J76_009149 [Diaphorina citri]KAI5747198.1 hypothetical protein M8J77_012170 [Diaphorina citri]
MVKRLCPFDDFQPQMKIHVGELERSTQDDLTKVYERTKSLLFGASTQHLQDTSNQTKVTSQTQPQVVQENLCHGCKSVNFLQSNQCWFCDSRFCGSCVAPCCLCFQVFCRDCSTIRYEQNNDVTVCLSCSST